MRDIEDVNWNTSKANEILINVPGKNGTKNIASQLNVSLIKLY